jgi:hypothetical protein
MQAQTDSAGLSAAEVAARLAGDGPNTVPPPPPRRLAGRIGRQLADPLVALLIAAAVVTTALRDLPDTAVILLVVTVNTVIGVVQEARADRAIGRLEPARGALGPGDPRRRRQDRARRRPGPWRPGPARRRRHRAGRPAPDRSLPGRRRRVGADRRVGAGTAHRPG